MGIMEIKLKAENEKQTIWDKMPEYEALGMNKEDIDISMLEDEESIDIE